MYVRIHGSVRGIPCPTTNDGVQSGSSVSILYVHTLHTSLHVWRRFVYALVGAF